MTSTPMSHIPETLARLRRSVAEGRARPIDWRRRQLDAARGHAARTPGRLRPGTGRRLGQVAGRKLVDRNRVPSRRNPLRAKTSAPVAQARAGADAAGGAARAKLDSARAARAGADPRGVELPRATDARTAGGRGRRRQLRGAQAVGTRSGKRGRDGSTSRRVSRPRRRRAGRGRRRSGDRTAGRAVRRDLLHRRHGGRADRDAGGRAEPDARHARTRRQVPLPGGPQRERRGGRSADRLGQVSQRRPNVRRAGLRAGRPPPAR